MATPFRITCESGRSYDVAIAILVAVEGSDPNTQWQLECDLDGEVILELPPLTVQNPPWDLIKGQDGNYFFEIDFTNGSRTAEELHDTDC